MRPYWTIFVDSFHQAFASRVLWIVLAVCTLVLLALLPLALQESQATQLSGHSVRDWAGLATQIEMASVEPADSPGKRIWQLADPDLRDAMVGAAVRGRSTQELRGLVERMAAGLNRLLMRPDFFAAQAWENVELDDTLAQTLERDLGGLSADEIAWVNRQLFQTAFPRLVARLPETELQLTYAGWRLGGPLPLSRELARPAIARLLTRVLDFLVGTLAVFVAILVTAPIIPQIFESGSIDLLLSKPISRCGLLLVKFLGGCAFILLTAGYLLVGLWLILGLRFGLWNQAVLACLPVFLFLFVVYYSVSTLVAVRWKNPIVAVVVTILFWAVCFTVGVSKQLIDRVYRLPERLVTLVPGADELLAVDQSGRLVEWQAGDWEPVLAPESSGARQRFSGTQMMLGPVYHQRDQTLLYLEPSGGRRRFGFLLAGPRFYTASQTLGSWRSTRGPTPPIGTAWLFLDPEETPVFVTTYGVLKLELNRPSPPAADAGIEVLGMRIPLPTGLKQPFTALGPEPALRLVEPFAAAMHPQSGDLVTFSGGQLVYLKRQDSGHYQRSATRDFSPVNGPAALGFAGSWVLLVRSDGVVQILKADDLTTHTRFLPDGQSEPYRVETTADGHWFAVLFHSGALWLHDPRSGAVCVLDDDVSAVAFDGLNHLLAADRGRRVTRYELASLTPVAQQTPPLDLLETIYQYAILPCYTLFPKPGELGDVVQHLITGQQTVALGSPVAADAREARARVDLWGPVFSSLAFVLVMLSIACVDVWRMDI